PVIHAAALKLWGKNLPWAWPRDGRRETLEGAGKPLADQYRAQGLEMLHQHAQFEDGSVSVEAGIADMLIRMEGGRFKVLKHLNDWFDEFRLYHRKAKAFHALFGRIGARAKMQFPIHPHMLRHGCGYALANAGHDTRALQAWLGHKNIQHTVRY